MTWYVRFAWISLAVILYPAAAAAQYGWQAGMAGAAGNKIAGTGTVTLRRAPAELRMHVELLGKGKTMDEALARLKDRREAALAQLEALKADKASIKFTSPSLSKADSARQRQFEAMVRQRITSRGRPAPKGLKLPQSVAVSVTLTANWPLSAGDPEKQLLEAHTLQEKLKAADLGGSKEAQKPSPEEEEAAEEMAEMTHMGGEENVPPGTPHFVYVARVSKEDRDKALAEAFVKAKDQAGRLAQAAGVSLGPLVGLSGSGGGQSSYGDDGMGSYRYGSYMQRLMMQQSQTGEDAQSDEAFASDPNALVFNFYVVATFDIGK